jgi:biopolymer transport protein ExbD
VKFPRQRPHEELINLTPLIDVVFQLLVFFMLAGSMKPTEAFPVDLAASQSRTFGDTREGVVLLRADGMVGFNQDVMTRPELLQAVSALLTANPNALIQIKADADADANLVIEVMEQLREAGVGYIVLLTKGAGVVEDAP